MIEVYWRKVSSPERARGSEGYVVASWEMSCPPRKTDQVMLGQLDRALHRVVEVTWTSSRTCVAWIVDVEGEVI